MLNEWVRSAIQRVVVVSIHHRLVVFAVALILSAASIFAAATMLKINTDAEGMLSRSLPFQEGMLGLRAAFPTARDTVVTIVDSPLPDAADAAAAAIAESLEGRPGIGSVFSPSTDEFFDVHGFLYRDFEALQKDFRDLSGAAPLLTALREEASLPSLYSALAEMHADPAVSRDMLSEIESKIAEVIEARAESGITFLSWQRLFDPEADERSVRRIVEVVPILDYAEFQPAEQARDSAFQAVESGLANLDEGVAAMVDVSVTGDPIMRYDELESVTDGIALSLGASLVAVVILLIVCFRSVARMVATVVSLVVALILALGFASATLGPLNLVSIAFVVPLVGLGLDFAIHVLVRVGEEERDGVPRFEAFSDAGRGVGLALGLSAVTTAAAFLSFVGTDFIGMAQVGIIGSVGVLIAFLLSITLVPALASLRPAKAPVRTVQAPQPEGKPHRTLDRLRDAAALVLVVLAAASLLVIDDVRFETDPLELRDPSSPSMVALHKLMDDPRTAPYRLSFLGSREEVEAFAQEVRDLPEVGEVITPDDLVPQNQEPKIAAMRDAFMAARREASQDEGAPRFEDPAAALRAALAQAEGSDGAQALLSAMDRIDADNRAAVEDGLFAFFRPLVQRLEVQRLAQPFGFDGLPEALQMRFQADDGTFRADVAPARDISDQDTLREFVAAVRAVNDEVVGAPLSISEAGRVVSGAMLQASAVAGIIVLVVCFTVLRSVAATLAVIVPLLVAGLLLAGAMALFDLPFNYANVIVLPLIIGLGVDSAIHLSLRHDEEDEDHVYGTSTPRAVTFSALTTAVAFASLALSSHRGTASMGELLALSIAIVLAATIVLTPTVLDLARRRADA